MDKNSNNKNKDKDSKKGFFHFRFNFRRKHHSLIVDKEKDEYKFFSLTHSSKRGNNKNIKLEKNPNSKDKKTAYIETRLLKDKENTFDKKKKSWSLSKADKNKVLKLYNSKLNSSKRRNKKKNK